MAIVEARDTIRRALAIAIVALARAERCPYSEPGSQKILAKKMKMLLGTLADDDLSLAMPGMMVVYHLKTLPRAVSSYAQNRCEPLTASAWGTYQFWMDYQSSSSAFLLSICAGFLNSASCLNF